MLDIIIQNLDTITGILAIIVAIYFYFKQKKRKYLDYKPLNNLSLLEVGKEIQEDIIILYKNNPIEKVNLIEIEIKNNGNEVIKEKDFIDPIELHFGEGSEILTHNIINKSQPNMIVNTEIIIDLFNGNKLLIRPRLMNFQEKFTVKLLVSKMKEIIVESRIEGIRKMRNELYYEVNYGDIIMPFLMLFFGIFLTYLTIFLNKEKNLFNYILPTLYILVPIFGIYKISIKEIKKYILRFK